MTSSSLDALYGAAEYQSEFLQEEPVRYQQGKDISVLAPGAGAQRAIMEGNSVYARSRDARSSQTPEQLFRRTMLSYLSSAYSNMSTDQQYSITDQATHVPLYQNLYVVIFAAAIYFRQRAGITKRSELTPALFNKYAAEVLVPLTSGKLEVKKVRLGNMSASNYLDHLKADLLRHLRYILRDA